MKKITIDPDKDWKETSIKLDRPDKNICISRYGGFGDAIQTSNIVDTFKQLGYYVCVNGSEATYDILKSNPNIDEFIYQTTNQIQNKDLGEYWQYLSDAFTGKLIVFSESIEGSLLALPGRVNYNWHKNAIHKYMDHNYIEFMCDIAGVSYIPENTKFYPTKKESQWAISYKNKINPNKKKVILWALSGSSMHKVSPYTDNVLAQLMLDDSCIVVLCGEPTCKILEQGWGKEKRVICKSGKWSIRETLAFAQVADIVVGPETGVLNAVSMEPNYKVISLSHSSVKNLTRDWVNTISLTPVNCECYPCHKLHYSTNSCTLNEATNVPECVNQITPDIIYNAIQRCI